MKVKKTQLIATALMVLFLAMNLVAVLGETPQAADEPSVKVAVSILPQTEWVQEVGGNHVEVLALIPAGSSPHSHQPTDTELTFIADADVWFQIGLVEFDIAHQQSLIDAGDGLQVVNLSVGIETIELDHAHDHDHDDHNDNHHHHGVPHSQNGGHGVDPHIWNSPTRVIQMVQKINETLCDLDPANAEDYSNNAAAYIEKLETLHENIEGYMEDVQNRHMLIFHPSWGYFAAEYDLEMIALEDEGKDPASSHFAEVLDKAKEKEVGVIFTQAQISATVAESFAQEACVEVVQINPLAANYIENMNTTAQLIAEKLDQPPECQAAIPGYHLGALLSISILSLFAITWVLKKQRA